MMRRTAACAALALAIYLSSWITLENVPLEVSQPVLLDGIDVVVIQRGSASIKFTVGPPSARFDPATVGRLKELRQGRVLVLWPEEVGHPSFELDLPPTIRRLVVNGASIHVEPKLELTELEVRTRFGLDWSGDVQRLRILDNSVRQGCTSCGDYLSINGGDIGSLYVRTRQGIVKLEDPDDIGRARFTFGTEARYAQGAARRHPDLRVTPWQPDKIENTEPEQEPR